MYATVPATGNLAFLLGWETLYTRLTLSTAPTTLTARKQEVELILMLRVKHPNCWFSFFSF